MQSDIELIPPQPYIDFLKLWKDASLVLTDSGGLQEETTALGIPCFTIRKNTERPITIEEGTNILAGTTKESILSAYSLFKNSDLKKGKIPEILGRQNFTTDRFCAKTEISKNTITYSVFKS